jgi:RNA polymerase sigma-70 factor (ECF subfamily)
MLGSVSEAEDVVQDAFVRLAQGGDEHISSRKAFVATVTTRLAIDELRSARTRRESYFGPWLPEPLPGDGAGDVAAAAKTADSLTMAFLVVLENLTPPERAAFCDYPTEHWVHLRTTNPIESTFRGTPPPSSTARR